MNLADIAIKKSTITWTLTVVCLVLGYIAYSGLPRLEDPEFAIKEAVVRTPYPGASPEEVEKEVTEKIEKAIQQLGQLKRVESYSEAGASIVRVVIKDNYTMDMLPDVWDELRRKILDVIPELPPGAGPLPPVCVTGLSLGAPHADLPQAQEARGCHQRRRGRSAPRQ